MTEYMYNVLARHNRFDLGVRNILAADPVNLRDLLAVATKQPVHRRSVTRMHTCIHERKVPCEAFFELPVSSWRWRILRACRCASRVPGDSIGSDSLSVRKRA